MMSMDQPTLCCLPKMPCGRTSRTMMRIGQRAGVTHIVGDDERAHVRHDADDQRADQRAVGGAEAAERHRGEHQQDQGRAGVPGDAVQVDAEQHAGQGCHRAREDPDHADHLIHVDAGCRGERRVVGHGSCGAAESRLVKEQGDADDHADGDERGDQRRHVGGDRSELEAVRHRFDDAFDVATEEELERVLQRHGQADGDDHLLHGADVASA